jgi:hypothetical protein
VAILLTALVGFPVTNRYLERRYANSEFDEPIGGVARWARDVRGARIGVAAFPMTYPIFGPHGIDNDVEYVRAPSSSLSFLRPQTCDAWRALLQAERFDYVVLGGHVRSHPPCRETVWTREDDGAREVRRDGPTSVFALDARVPPSPCTDQRSGD